MVFPNVTPQFFELIMTLFSVALFWCPRALRILPDLSGIRFCTQLFSYNLIYQNFQQTVHLCCRQKLFLCHHVLGRLRHWYHIWTPCSVMINDYTRCMLCPAPAELYLSPSLFKLTKTQFSVLCLGMVRSNHTSPTNWPDDGEYMKLRYSMEHLVWVCL